MAGDKGEYICYRDPSKDIQKTVTDTTKPKFDVVTIAADNSYRWDHSGSGFVMLYLNGNLTVSSTGSETVSSLTPAKTFKISYNTTDNKCYFDDNTTSLTQVSFPIARFTATGAITSIDQVFNGFGYIGSTVFALPGVKGLIPNGRNEDGSLKNIEFTLSGVQTVSLTTHTFTNRSFVLRRGDMGFTNTVYYDAVNNTNYDFTSYMIAATGSANNGKITSFTPKTAFHAVDRNDSSWLSGLGMPSRRYIDLTPGASGATYTAPANGYFLAVCGGDVRLQSNSSTLATTTGATALGGGSLFLPVEKNEQVIIQYSTTQYLSLKFIYTEGEN